MASELLSATDINDLITKYQTAESNRRVTPLSTRKTNYETLNTTYSDIASKFSSLKSVLTSFTSSTNSVFNYKTGSSSNDDFIGVSSSSESATGSFGIRIDQLAKSDLVLSKDLDLNAASTAITVPGIHTFTLKGGDGAGDTLVSNVEVEFEATDFDAGSITNKKVMEKIQLAIKDNKGIISSNSVTGTSSATGTFKINLNGLETEINYTAGTYEEMMDSIITQVNSISGVSAEKIDDGGGNFSLKFNTVSNSNYIKISSDSSTLLSELGITSEKRIAASGLVTASVFSPESLKTQFSFTAKNSGYDYRLTEMTDTNGGSALASMGLNLGASRTSYLQDPGEDTPGFVYDTSVLNSKFEFNGINIERSSNIVSDLVNGTTLSLKSTMEASDPDVSVTVETDSKKIKEKIQEFIEKFNGTYAYIREKQKSIEGVRGTLASDSTAESIVSLFRTISVSPVDGINPSSINTFSKIGISFNSNDGLEISDGSRFDKAIGNSLDQVTNLFNSPKGIATTLVDRITPYLGGAGYLSKSQDNFGSMIKSTNDSIERAEAYIEKSSNTLRQKYYKMVSQYAQLMTNQRMFSAF
ncbi:MAG: flagellar filament capping protein FliD [Melioribacteraceae bacterium]|nr:flagellar filament capping protein FliD [Melioribacteraceae bacterium]